ncbi:MAG: TMEM175 family protein [Methanoregulaceae archaeon]|nr:TMEM175 family protein [Methanoregulaceae archaeon]
MEEACDTIPSGLSKNRIETLTDGIFAIAMTLLVLGVIVPHQSPPPTIIEFLIKSVPELIEYAIGFLALAVIWVLHHQQFHYIRFIDRPILWLNILALLFVGLMPFSTSLADVYAENRLAEIIIGLNLLTIGIIFYLQWVHAARNRCLMSPDITDRVVRSERRRNLVIPGIALVGTMLALFGFGPGIIVYFLIPVIFAIFPRLDHKIPH